jgi:uridine nucleosidase
LLFISFCQDVPKLRIADFVHGNDGLGNTYPPPPKGEPVGPSAKDFLTKMARENLNEVTVVALGPLTNIALVQQIDHNLILC